MDIPHPSKLVSNFRTYFNTHLLKKIDCTSKFVAFILYSCIVQLYSFFWLATLAPSPCMIQTRGHRADRWVVAAVHVPSLCRSSPSLIRLSRSTIQLPSRTLRS